MCVTESHDNMNNMTCRKERSPVVTSWQRNTAWVKIGSKQGINIETKRKRCGKFAVREQRTSISDPRTVQHVTHECAHQGQSEGEYKKCK